MRAEELTSNAIYDSRAATYGFDVEANKSTRIRRDLILKYVRSDHRVLDVGCANGIYLRVAAPHCASVVGVDISEPMLAEARAAMTNPNVTLELQSATDLKFPDASFDVAYSFSTLQLVPDIEIAFRELHRVLRPGGILLVDLAGFWNLSHLYWNLYYRRNGHAGLKGFSLPGGRRFVSRIGFEVLESQATGLLDQWRYIPGLHLCKWMDGVVHRNDMDYRVSNAVPSLANRWHFALKK